MTKEILQYYIDNSYLPMKQFTLGKLNVGAYSEGYAKDKDGWYCYTVSERQHISKHYYETEQDCIDETFNRLKFALENEHQDLPELQTEETNIWSEEDQRAWLETEVNDDIGTKEALELCSEKMGFEKDIYKMIIQSSFQEIVDLNILSYEQIQVLDIVWYELNDDEE